MRFSPSISALLGALHVASSSLTSPLVESTDACSKLVSALPGKTSVPGEADYAASQRYWSAQQASVTPACFFYPSTAADVSAAIKVLASLAAPFTVKGGGHTAFAGGSSIQGGVTVDLGRLNQISVAQDRATVSVGPGARWDDVSAVLDPLGLAVVGGRASRVGVSGLILGGGVSYFSGRHGWACDNVRAFEVVLASGDVVVATPTEHSDLYWALRGGGGSHFGVVTRFDLESNPQGDIWKKLSIYPLADPSNTQVVDHFVQLGMVGLNEDVDAHNFLLIGDRKETGGSIFASFLFHAKAPADPQTVPAVFANITSVPGALLSTANNANVSTRLAEAADPYGFRQGWYSAAVKLTPRTAELISEVIIPAFRDHVSRLHASAAEIGGDDALFPWVSFQPISVTTLRAMEKNGGNALGLRVDEGPFVHMNTAHTWTRPELDGIIEQGMSRMVAVIEEGAATRGIESSWKYMNYAGKAPDGQGGQDVYGGYGAASRDRLRQVAEKYDPNGVLKRLWRGYFEL